MWFFLSAFQAVFDLKRVCRWCGKSHVVALRDKTKTIPCTRCGKRIRPPQDRT